MANKEVWKEFEEAFPEFFSKVNSNLRFWQLSLAMLLMRQTLAAQNWRGCIPCFQLAESVFGILIYVNAI